MIKPNPTHLLALFLLSILPLFSQSRIDPAEAKAFIIEYYERSMRADELDFLEDYFRPFPKEEETPYGLVAYGSPYLVRSVEDNWVEVLVSHSGRQWDQLYYYQLTRQADSLFIVPDKTRNWWGDDHKGYQREKRVFRPITREEFRQIRRQLLGYRGLTEADLEVNHPAFLGSWKIKTCLDCFRFLPVGPDGNRRTFHFEKEGVLSKNGEWFVVQDSVYVRFPGSGDLKIGHYEVLKDSSLWVSFPLSYDQRAGFHLVPADRFEPEPTPVLPSELLPQVRVLVQPRFDRLDCYQTDRIIYQLEHRSGIMDTLGNALTEARYQNIIFLDQEGKAMANLDGRAVMLDSTGQVIKEFDFELGSEYMTTSGYLEIRKNGKVGLVDKRGELLIPPIYDVLRSQIFPGYVVNLEEQWGLIDPSGRTLVPIEYDGIAPLSPDMVVLTQDGKSGLFDLRTRKFRLPIDYDQIEYIPALPYLWVSEAGSTTFYDLDGHPLAGQTYDLINWLGQGYLGVERNGKQGVINRDLATVLPIQYEGIITADGDVQGWFHIRRGAEDQVIDSTGAVVPSDLLSEQRAQEELKLNQDMEQYHQFEIGSAVLKKQRQGNNYGLVDQSGQWVIPPVYEHIDGVFQRGILATRDGFDGVISPSGEILLPFIFDRIQECVGSDRMMVKYRGKLGLLQWQ